MEALRNAMFSGDASTSPKIARCCTPPASPVRPPLVVEGVDGSEREVAKVLKRMQRFVESIHNGSLARPHRQADPRPW